MQGREWAGASSLNSCSEHSDTVLVLTTQETDFTIVVLRFDHSDSTVQP